MRVLGIFFYCLLSSLCVADWALLYLGPRIASAPKHCIHCQSSNPQSLIITNFFLFPLTHDHYLFILADCRYWPYTMITNPAAMSHSEKVLRNFNEILDIIKAYAWGCNQVDRPRVFCLSSEYDLIRTLNRYSGLWTTSPPMDTCTTSSMIKSRTSGRWSIKCRCYGKGAATLTYNPLSHSISYHLYSSPDGAMFASPVLKPNQIIIGYYFL